MNNTLAVKALNQYRQRDIFAYLALRYYISSAVGRQDRWINEVCTRLTRQDTSGTYQKLKHFKEQDVDGEIVHRDIYLPSPSEILAETSLITELSRDKYKSFHPRPFVYSYRLAKPTDKGGVFQPYFDGLKERHRSIAAECKKNNNYVVLYTDIKKFYPTIRIADAKSVWEAACSKSGIDKRFRELGLTILGNHAKVNQSDSTGEGLLTGPLFSHLIANLIMDEIDDEMHRLTGGKYWRYVDDIVLVGEKERVAEWRNQLANKCQNLGLTLHSGDKDFLVDGEEWLKGEFDFNNSISIDWVSLIANIKRFLLARPSKMDSLINTFQANHIRIPVLDYSTAIKDRSYLRKAQDWLRRYHWAKNNVREISVESLLDQALACRDNYLNQLKAVAEVHSQNAIYGRKRNLPKIRFFAGRLAYLLSHEQLSALNDTLREVDGLELLVETTTAIATNDFSTVVRMGANATHAAAQLKVAEGKDLMVHIDPNLPYDEAFAQSLAVLAINELKHDYRKTGGDDLLVLASGKGLKQCFRSENKFISEFACLCGVNDIRHQELLNSCFDRDETLAMDLLVQIHNSSGV